MKKQVPVIQGSILNNIGKNVIHYKIMHIGLLFIRNRFTDTDTEDTEIDKILERGYTCPHYKYKKFNSIRIKLIVFKIQYNLRNTGESFF